MEDRGRYWQGALDQNHWDLLYGRRAQSNSFATALCPSSKQSPSKTRGDGINHQQQEHNIVVGAAKVYKDHPTGQEPQHRLDVDGSRQRRVHGLPGNHAK